MRGLSAFTDGAALLAAGECRGDGCQYEGCKKDRYPETNGEGGRPYQWRRYLRPRPKRTKRTRNEVPHVTDSR